MPLRITLLGDTHLGRNRDWLPSELVRALRTSDLILHTGDFSSRRAFDLIRSFSPLLAVRGNNDEPELAAELPERLTLVAGSLTIEVTHGHLERGRTAKESVVRAWAGKADVVVFGHSHRASKEEIDGTLFLNPGSPTMKRWEPAFSFATLEINSQAEFRADVTYFARQTRSSGSRPDERQ